MSNPYSALAYYSRLTMLVSYAGLLIVISLGTLVWPSCNREPSVVIWGIQIALLLVFLPALIKANGRSIAWLTFMLLIFFLTAVPVAFACVSVLTVAEVAIISVLFIAAMMNIRWHSRSLKHDVQANVSADDISGDSL